MWHYFSPPLPSNTFITTRFPATFFLRVFCLYRTNACSRQFVVAVLRRCRWLYSCFAGYVILTLAMPGVCLGITASEVVYASRLCLCQRCSIGQCLCLRHPTAPFFLSSQRRRVPWARADNLKAKNIVTPRWVSRRACVHVTAQHSIGAPASTSRNLETLSSALSSF